MSESHKPLVLIVDDQHNWRDLLVDILEDEYQITTADSYARALDILLKQNQPFHVVITDIRLDDNDSTNEQGLDFLDKLDAQTNYTKSIVITGYATIPTAKRAFKDLEVFEYVEKVPAGADDFDPASFRRIVHEAASAAIRQQAALVARSDHRLLVVDDDPRWRDELATILRDDHYQVDTCDGIDALPDFLKAHSYSLIILNVSFATDDPALFYKIWEFQPTQIVLAATAPQVAVALEAVQDGKAYGIVLIDNPLDEQRFRLLIQRALMTKSPIGKYLALGRQRH